MAGVAGRCVSSYSKRRTAKIVPKSDNASALIKVHARFILLPIRFPKFAFKRVECFLPCFFFLSHVVIHTAVPSRAGPAWGADQGVLLRG